MQAFGFRLYAPGSLTHADVQWCPGSAEPPASQLQPIPTGYKALFILGSQKAGTTWLYNALQQHPAFVAPKHGYKCALPTGRQHVA